MPAISPKIAPRLMHSGTYFSPVVRYRRVFRRVQNPFAVVHNFGYLDGCNALLRLSFGGSLSSVCR